MATNTKVTFHKQDNLPSSDLEVGGIYFTKRPGYGDRYKINIATSEDETIEVRSNDCIFFEDIAVPTSAREDDTTYPAYPKKWVVQFPNSGITEDMIATVFFEPFKRDTTTYLITEWAPFCETGTNTITVWSKSAISGGFTIPLIKVERV